MLLTICIEWSPRDVNNTTICMRTVLVVMAKNYKLTLNSHKRQRTTYCGFVSSLKSDCNHFSRCYVASQFRDVNLNDYFSNENQPMSIISVSQREAETGHQIGHYSMPRRCIREANDITPSIDVVMLDDTTVRFSVS